MQNIIFPPRRYLFPYTHPKPFRPANLPYVRKPPQSLFVCDSQSGKPTTDRQHVDERVYVHVMNCDSGMGSGGGKGRTDERPSGWGGWLLLAGWLKWKWATKNNHLLSAYIVSRWFGVVQRWWGWKAATMMTTRRVVVGNGNVQAGSQSVSMDTVSIQSHWGTECCSATSGLRRKWGRVSLVGWFQMATRNSFAFSHVVSTSFRALDWECWRSFVKAHCMALGIGNIATSHPTCIRIKTCQNLKKRERTISRSKIMIWKLLRKCNAPFI